MTEEQLEEKYGQQLHQDEARCLFYEDIDVIVHLQIVFYYWFPETFI